MRNSERYAGIIAQHALCVCVVCTLVTSLLTGLAFVLTNLPDFADPTEGFNTSGTTISDKLSAFRALQNEIGPGKQFHQYSAESRNNMQYVSRINDKRLKPNKSKKKNRTGRLFKNLGSTNKATGRCNVTVDGRYICDLGEQIATEPRFCAIDLSSIFAVLSFEVDQLISWSTFDALCSLEQALWLPDSAIRMLSKSEKCLLHQQGNTCCQPWHFASLATSFLNKQRCADVTESDFESFRLKFIQCLPAKRIISNCYSMQADERSQRSDYVAAMNSSHALLNTSDCASIPIDCISFNFYTLLSILAPIDDASLEKNLTLMILPIEKALVAQTRLLSSSSGRRQFLNGLRNLLNAAKSVHAELRLIGADLGVTDELFLDQLLDDTLFGILAFLVVLTFVWIFSTSLCFTVCIAYIFIASLGVAYSVYKIFFDSFFPFVNLLTLVLMVGLGADDAFVYWTAWQKTKVGMNTITLEKMVHEALSETVPIMFLTSLTTALSFAINMLSRIYVIRCFGLFACLAITANFLLSVTLLPAFVVLLHLGSYGHLKTLGRISRFRPVCIEIAVQPILLCKALFDSCCQNFFQNFLPFLVVRFRYVWSFSLLALTAFSSYVVFYYPGLRLPYESDDYFQRFHAEDPFEKWATSLKSRFRLYNSENLIESDWSIPIRVVWGVEPYLEGTNGLIKLWPNGSFGMEDSQSLQFLSGFCYELLDYLCLNCTKSMSYNNFLHFSNLLPFCFAPDFMRWMSGPCTDALDVDRKPCCIDSLSQDLPVVFQTCLRRMIDEFPADFFGSLILADKRNALPYSRSGPLFDLEGQYRALIVTFPTNFAFTTSYERMRKFYSEVDSWMEVKLDSAPASLKNGWWISDFLDYYDLQRALMHDTTTAILITLIVAFISIFMSTCDLTVSLACVITVSAVILTTLALIILYGWKLNVIESTIVVLTVGLSFDYTLHYASAYLSQMRAIANNSCKQPKFCSVIRAFFSQIALSASAAPSPSLLEDRKLGYHSHRSFVNLALAKSAAPIFGAAFTTLLAGACVLPTSTAPYGRVGIFMITVTTVSWTYATFFLCPLLFLIEKWQTNIFIPEVTVNSSNGRSLDSQRELLSSGGMTIR